MRLFRDDGLEADLADLCRMLMRWDAVAIADGVWVLTPEASNAMDGVHLAWQRSEDLEDDDESGD